MSSLNPFKSSSSSGKVTQPAAAVPTSAEKALDFERTNTWNDIKTRFWPMDVEAFTEGDRTERGRKVREERAVGAAPMGYNRYGGGVVQADGAASGAAGRMAGLRQNEQDRKQANTVNTIRNQREIQGQGISEMVGAAGIQHSANMRRNASQHAVNQGISAGIGQVAGTVGGYYAANSGAQQPGLQQPTTMAPNYVNHATPNYVQYGR